MVAVPSGHRLTQLNRQLTAEDLHGEDLIMHSPTQARYFYDLVVSLVSSHRTFVHTVSQILTMIFLVAAGRGIALVPQSATVLGIDGVEYIELGGFEVDPVELHAIWMRNSRNPALHRVLEVINEQGD